MMRLMIDMMAKQASLLQIIIPQIAHITLLLMELSKELTIITKPRFTILK